MLRTSWCAASSRVPTKRGGDVISLFSGGGESWANWPQQMPGTIYYPPEMTRLQRCVMDVGGWPVTFEVFVRVTFIGGIIGSLILSSFNTRVYIPLEPGDKFRFRLTPKHGANLFDDIEKTTGISFSRRIRLQNAAIDRQFVLTSNDATRARALFDNPRVQGKLPRNTSFALRVGRRNAVVREFPRGPRYLMFYRDGVITEIAEARAICALMAETMRAMTGSSGPARFG